MFPSTAFYRRTVLRASKALLYHVTHHFKNCRRLVAIWNSASSRGLRCIGSCLTASSLHTVETWRNQHHDTWSYSRIISSQNVHRLYPASITRKSIWGILQFCKIPKRGFFFYKGDIAGEGVVLFLRTPFSFPWLPATSSGSLTVCERSRNIARGASSLLFPLDCVLIP